MLDLVQIHSLRGVDVLFPHLYDLKRKGRIRYVGITTSDSAQHDAMVELINTQPLDFIQVDYSLGNRAAADKVLPAALAKRVGVLINLPFGGRRDGNLFSRVAGRDLPESAEQLEVTQLGPVVPEVRRVASGRHGGHSGHDQGGAPRGKSRGAAWPHAGRGDARAHRKILGSELRRLMPEQLR